jgi:hypothetical protein
MKNGAGAWGICLLVGGFIAAGCEPGPECDYDCEEPADDPSTPGDDRAGYVWCGETPASGVTCPPDTLCCLTSSSCATHEQGCQDPFNVATCDGPEDCTGAGERCQMLSHDRTCRAEGIWTWCHTDADCRALPGLPDGRCTSSGVCEFVSEQ